MHITVFYADQSVVQGWDGPAHGVIAAILRTPDDPLGTVFSGREYYWLTKEGVLDMCDDLIAIPEGASIKYGKLIPKELFHEILVVAYAEAAWRPA